MVESRHGATNPPATLVSRIDELEHHYRTAKEPTEWTCWQILWLLAQGRTATELSSVIGYRAYWIGQIAKRDNEQGPQGMRNRRHTTSYRPAPVLSAEQQGNCAPNWPGPLPGTSTGGHARSPPG
jgi:hypothetical protein